MVPGHEDWVNSVRWLHRYSETAPLCLLSSSMDKTMVLWMLDEESGLWIERVGVISMRARNDWLALLRKFKY